LGLTSAWRDSGSTATFAGASRGFKRNTVCLSMPLVFGASSSTWPSIKAGRRHDHIRGVIAAIGPLAGNPRRVGQPLHGTRLSEATTGYL